MNKLEDILKQSPEMIYKCEMCQETFPAPDVVLTEPKDKIVIFSESKFLYVDKDGFLISNYEPPSSAKDHKILTCPHCDAQNPFGFRLPDAWKGITHKNVSY